MSFDLGAITRTGGHFGPQRILIYGVRGLGKTTFGCSFEAPILLRTEDGAGALDVATFPTIAASYAMPSRLCTESIHSRLWSSTASTGLSPLSSQRHVETWASSISRMPLTERAT